MLSLNPLCRMVGRATAHRQRPRRRPSHHPRNCHLEIETLEGRTLPSYTFIPIDVPGATATDAWGINASGQIVGSYTADGMTHGFLLRGGSYTTLDVPGSTSTTATAINASGRVVGSYTAGGTTHGFLLSHGTYTTFDVPGATFTMPRGISSSGRIVGQYTDAGGTPHGFLLSRGVFTTIDVPGATFTSYASDINGRGQIVGRFDTASTNYGFLLSGGSYTTLDVPGSVSSAALGINNSGQIVGGYTAGGIRHGYLWSGGTYTTIDVPGSTFTTPRKINNSDAIVGGYGADGTTHGFLATAESSARAAGVAVNDGSAQRSMVTFAELAGIGPGHAVDGQSLAPLFGHDAPSSAHWRQDFLVEIYRRLPPLGNGDAIRVLRTQDGIYVEYESGPRELYDLRADPYQLESQHDTAPPGHLRWLSRRLGELATCAGDSCRE